jgi:hypothetical protein
VSTTCNLHSWWHAILPCPSCNPWIGIGPRDGNIWDKIRAIEKVNELMKTPQSVTMPGVHKTGVYEISEPKTDKKSAVEEYIERVCEHLMRQIGRNLVEAAKELQKEKSLTFEEAWPEIKAGKEFRVRFEHDGNKFWTIWLTKETFTSSYTFKQLEKAEFQIKREAWEGEVWVSGPKVVSDYKELSLGDQMKAYKIKVREVIE